MPTGDREMTLEEWVGRLREGHGARKELTQLGAEITSLKQERDLLQRHNEAFRTDMASLVERAERVNEGEDWDLAEFILRKAIPTQLNGENEILWDVLRLNKLDDIATMRLSVLKE